MIMSYLTVLVALFGLILQTETTLGSVMYVSPVTHTSREVGQTATFICHIKYDAVCKTPEAVTVHIDWITTFNDRGTPLIKGGHNIVMVPQGSQSKLYVTSISRPTRFSCNRQAEHDAIITTSLTVNVTANLDRAGFQCRIWKGDEWYYSNTALLLVNQPEPETPTTAEKTQPPLDIKPTTGPQTTNGNTNAQPATAAGSTESMATISNPPSGDNSTTTTASYCPPCPIADCKVNIPPLKSADSALYGRMWSYLMLGTLLLFTFIMQF